MQFTFGQTIVGSTASTPYPTLSSAVGASVLTVTSGVCTDNFTVEGDFIIDIPVDFQGSQIVFQANSGFTIQEHTILSNSADISGLAVGTYINESFSSLPIHTVVFQTFDSDVQVLEMLHDASSSTIWEFDNSYISANDGIEVSNGCRLLIRNNSFVDATDISCYGSPFPYLEITDSDMHNSCEVFMESGSAVALNVDWWGAQAAFTVGSGSPFQFGLFLPVWILINDCNFADCDFGIFGLTNHSQVNHVYNSKFNNGIAAVTSECNELIFNGNEVDLFPEAAVIYDSDYSEVKDNIINDCGTLSSAGYGAVHAFSGSSDGSHVDNIIDNCWRGITVSNSSDFDILSNTVTNSTNHGFFQESSTNIYTGNNTADVATNAGLLVDNVDQASVWCNLFTNASNGADFSNTCMDLDYQQNVMENNTSHGLFYQSSLDAAPQIEKGNLWKFNAFDAGFDGSPSTSTRFNNRYEVRPVVFEDPATVDPGSGWFFNTGTSLPPLNCFTIGDPGDELPGGGFNQAEVYAGLVDCESSTEPGQCMWNKMLVLKKIEDDPSLLNNNDLYEFYNTYQGTVLDQLPLHDEILQSTAMPESLKFDFDFVYDADGNIQNWEEYLDYMDQRMPELNDYSNNRLTVLENWLNDIERINVTNQLEQDYKDLIMYSLEDQLGDTTYKQEADRIQYLANQCLGEYGPAIYFGRSLSRKNEWSYTEKFSCSSSGRSSQESEYIYSGVFEIVPNPAVDQIEIISNDNLEEITIMDVSGKVVFSKTNIASTNLRINLGAIPSGIYFVHSTSIAKPVKLVVQ